MAVFAIAVFVFGSVFQDVLSIQLIQLQMVLVKTFSQIFPLWKFVENFYEPNLGTESFSFIEFSGLENFYRPSAGDLIFQQFDTFGKLIQE